MSCHDFIEIGLGEASRVDAMYQWRWTYIFQKVFKPVTIVTTCRNLQTQNQQVRNNTLTPNLYYWIDEESVQATYHICHVFHTL